MRTRSAGWQAAPTVASLLAAAYVAGSLDDARQRELLTAKLGQIEGKRQQLGRMSEFLRAKLNDLETAHQNECCGKPHPAIQNPPPALQHLEAKAWCRNLGRW